MRFDLNKSFPYPVLRPHSDDYRESDFQCGVEIAVSQSGLGSNTVEFAFECLTSSDDLLGLIVSGKAAYMGVVSCRSTYTRVQHRSEKPNFTIKIPAGDLCHEVKVDVFIVAIDKIEQYRPDDCHVEYGDRVFDLEAGSVLAQEESFQYFFDRELMKPVSSVFDWVVNDSVADGQWRLDLSSNRVRIGVSRRTKEVIDLARSKKAHRATLINSVYFSAVLGCLEAIRSSPDDYRAYKWFQVFEKQAQNEGLELDRQDPISVAQVLLKNPLCLLLEYVFADEKA